MLGPETAQSTAVLKTEEGKTVPAPPDAVSGHQRPAEELLKSVDGEVGTLNIPY